MHPFARFTVELRLVSGRALFSFGLDCDATLTDLDASLKTELGLGFNIITALGQQNHMPDNADCLKDLMQADQHASIRLSLDEYEFRECRRFLKAMADEAFNIKSKGCKREWTLAAEPAVSVGEVAGIG